MLAPVEVVLAEPAPAIVVVAEPAPAIVVVAGPAAAMAVGEAAAPATASAAAAAAAAAQPAEDLFGEDEDLSARSLTRDQKAHLAKKVTSGQISALELGRRHKLPTSTLRGWIKYVGRTNEGPGRGRPLGAKDLKPRKKVTPVMKDDDPIAISLLQAKAMEKNVRPKINEEQKRWLADQMNIHGVASAALANHFGLKKRIVCYYASNVKKGTAGGGKNGAAAGAKDKQPRAKKARVEEAIPAPVGGDEDMGAGIDVEELGADGEDFDEGGLGPFPNTPSGLGGFPATPSGLVVYPNAPGSEEDDDEDED